MGPGLPGPIFCRLLCFREALRPSSVGSPLGSNGCQGHETCIRHAVTAPSPSVQASYVYAGTRGDDGVEGTPGGLVADAYLVSLARA